MRWLLPFLSLLALAPVFAAEPADPDAHYADVLKAYRGQTPAEKVTALAETDPGPALYLGDKTPGEWGIARLFASLPNSAHATLQREGYLKWRATSLPDTQRQWLLARTQQVEKRGEGPYPLTGKDAATFGFARVEFTGLDGPQYSFWINSPAAKAPSFLTVVRVVHTLTLEYEEAHAARLKELEKLPETPPIPAGDWLRVKEPPAPTKPAVERPKTLMDEAFYWKVVKAYKGDLKSDQRELLGAGDPLIRKRLGMTDPADRSLNLLFAKLKEEQHMALLVTGKVLLRPAELTKDQRRLLEPVIARMNAQSRESGLGDVYDLIPYGRTIMGFSIVMVPDVEKPALSWWIKSQAAPTPAWVTLINGEAVKAPLYFRTHLEQLRPD
jgi:hypothetical protein